MYSPAYFQELREQLAFLVREGKGLCAIRYPRGKELYKPSYFESSLLPFTVYGPQTGEIALVTYGRIFSFAAETAELLGNLGYPVKLVKLNRIIPMDQGAVQAVSYTHLRRISEELRRKSCVSGSSSAPES